MLLQLGDQLIRSESIAVLELVKNSYDANASVATLRMRNLTNPADGTIEIEDDGDGMTLSTLRDVWMYPGTENKKTIAENHTASSKSRMPIGGKGIGRFGVHKLGYKIELISKAEGENEVKMNIDWRAFEKDALLDDIKVSIVENLEPTHFKNGMKGTLLRVSELRTKWTRGTVRELYRAVNSLSSPFEALDSFSTVFDLDNHHWLDGLIDFEAMKDQALYYANVEISKRELSKFTYEFRPWDTMDKLRARTVENNDGIRMIEHVRDEITGKKVQQTLDLEKYEIGIIRLELLIFDRSSKLLSLGVSDVKGYRDYLNQNGGIRVFRNGIRVYDYGEPGNDWLKLDLTRVNQPGKTISNNIVVGAIYLDKASSADLEEKTNREGFVENEAYFKFVAAVGFAIDKVLTHRNIDKELVRKFYGPKSTEQPVMGPLFDLQKKIETKVKNADLRKSLLSSIKTIEDDFETISEIYTRSASAGLSLSIVIHEIIHMITELSKAVQNKQSDPHVKSLVRSLQRTTSNYAAVIRQTKKSKNTLSEIIDQSLANTQFRIKAHKLDIDKRYKKSVEANEPLPLARNLMISSLINLIDNSLWWQNYSMVKNKKILIDVVVPRPGFIGILFADNGPGFSIPTDEAIKPFVSDRPEGMGLGLHLAHEVMKGQKGILSFPQKDEFELPSEYRQGAKILLSFRQPK